MKRRITNLFTVLLVLMNLAVQGQLKNASSQNNHRANYEEVNEINASLKNGSGNIMSLDSIPQCSALWTYGGGTGVVPDNNSNGLTMNFNINDVFGNTLGTDVNLVGVSITLQHFRIGDITIELVAPNGTKIPLVDRMGYPATLPYGCTGKNINATFLRGTGVEAENVCNTPPPALKGVYSADFGFNLDSINLAGGSPNGTWKLKVYDSQAGEIGYVLGWKMYFDQQPPNASFTTNAIGLFVSLNAASTLNGNATYIWDFGDGDSAVGQSVIHQYPVRGQFTIRLLVIDACGIDSAKATYSLEPPPCFAEFPSTTTPTAITDNNPGGDTLVINTNQVIGSKLGKDVQLRKVCIQGTHPRVGDLKMKLISPGGIEILLIDRTYYPFQQPYGCLNSDFNFCIIHGDSNDGEFKCDATGAAIKGEFTAMTPQDLRQVNDLVTNPNGAWKLVVYDMAAGQTGVVTNWSLLFDQQDPDADYTYTFNGLTVDITSKNLPAVNYRWDFGDGTPIDTTKSPSHTYATPGTKTITVYTDNVCSRDTLIRSITLYACEEQFAYNAVPVAIPDYDSTGILIPFTISGIDGINLGVDAFITRVCITSDHIWPGDLKIQLIAPNGKVVPIINQPTRALTLAGCGAPGIDMCIVQGSGNDTRFVCDYVNAPPAIKGFYTANAGYPLESINLAGGNPNGTWYLNVFDYALFKTGNITSWSLYFGKLKPNVDFNYTANDSGLASFSIPNATTNYLWVFDNGDTSTSLTPTHQYPANGIYQVKLIASDSLCLSDSIIKDVYITSFNKGCVSPFVYQGAPVAIADADSINGSILNFNVSGVLGDTLGTNVNLFRVAVKGKHNRVGDLKLKLIAPNGLSTILTDRPGHPILSEGCTKRDFQFILSNGQGANLETMCNETGLALFGTVLSDKANDLGTLNFGGGSPNGIWQLVAYDYKTDWVGQIDGLSLYFDGQPTHADFIYNIKTDTVVFRHAAPLNATTKWSFGDGTFSNNRFPTKVYADTGMYQVKLVVTDTCGMDSITQIVHVTEVRPKCVDVRRYVGPKNIPNNSPAGVYINLNLNDVIGNTLGKDVSLVKVRLKGTISKVGDLSATLIAPNGKAVDLFNRVGYPAKPLGCERDNFDINFIRGFGPGAELVCNTVGTALAGTVTAMAGQNLDSINIMGGSPNGTWQLFMNDLAPNAFGKLDTFELFFDSQGIVNADYTFSQSLTSYTFNSANVSGVQYQWNFGDGTNATGTTTTHQFASSGTYNVTCYAKDSCRTDSVTKTFVVNNFEEPITCKSTLAATNLPLTIPNGASTGVDVVINATNLSGATLGTDVNLYKVNLIGTHDRVGDLIITLTAPNGKKVLLMDRPGYPNTINGCGGDNFNFSVIRGINASVENACLPALNPAITGLFSAEGDNLDSINILGGSPNGIWTVNISDNSPTVGGGTITAVELLFDKQSTALANFNTSVADNQLTATILAQSGVTYTWNFGDGYTATGDSVNHSYAMPGNYNVILQASDSCGFNQTIQQITAGNYPIVACTKSFIADSLPIAIPDNDTLGSYVYANLSNILGSTLGNDVRLASVCIKGNHTKVGDLKIKLIAPNGTSVTLMDRPGFPALGGCSGNDFNYCVVRGIGNTVENVCNAAVPTISGEFTAMDGYNLDSVNVAGGSPNGLWTLFVQDVAPANAGGNITGFTLTFDNQQGVNANFTYNVAGNGMQFNSANQLNAIYNWSFGDGNTSSLATPINNYTQSGTYTVVLVATDSCGTDSTTQMVNVFVYPEPTCTRNFDLTTAPVPMPDNIAPGAIIGATLSGIDGVNLGADVNLTGVCIKGKHTNVGDIRLVLVAPNGATVNLMNQPGAPASPKGCSGDDFDVCFIRSTGLSLEDTCRTTLPAIEGTFTASNGFDLQSINTAGGNPNGLWRLFAADLAPLDTGEITSVTLTFDSQILTNATFTYSLNNNEVQCTSIPSPNATYQWTFGDGSTSTDANPFYTYNTNGFFNISLTVTDTCGTLTTTQPISVFYYTEPTCVVSVPFTGLPVAIPNFDTTGVTVNLNVNGIDGVNLGTDVNLVGVCLNGAHPKVGDLRVLLVSPSGVSVELMNRPGFPGVACSGDDFDFCVIRGINNSNENSCEPIAPSIAGTFTALEGFNLDTINMVGGNPNGQWQLIVYDLANGNLGNLISASLIFDNQNTVNASFTVSQNGSTVQCNSANAINTSYNWTFSDGFTSTDANPTHNFALTGTYSINLIATDSCGSDSSTQQVNIVTYAPVTCAKSFDFTTIATAIPDNDITGLTLPLNITNVAGVLGTDVSLVSVCVSGTHTNVGDLKMELIAPNGKVVQLIDQPGFPLNATGCNGDDFNFCIERGIGADAENTCNVTVPAITGPFTAMSGFNLDSINIAGGNANGLWQLVIYDLLNGETGDVVTAQLVFDNQPQANATFGSTMNGYSVTLNAANVANTLYNWTLGDGNIATGATINHSYISNGAYVVTLTATDSCGSVSSVQGLIINEPITCERTYDYAVVPQNIPDNDTAGITLSYNLNGVAGNNLGLDVRLTGVCISGTHSRVGDVALSLTAPNLKTVTLMDRPGYPATASGCTTPDFDFCIIGGSGIDNEQACNATAPAISGSFIAINDNLDSINYFGGNPNGNWQLNATDLNAGETGSINAFKLLFNGQPPIADFTFVINGYDVTFTGPVLSNATYSWNFGDLGTSNLQNPTHTYANNGSYQVVLTVTDSCGTTLSVITLPITVGVNEIQTSNISIVPNPAHSFVDLLVFNSGLETMHVSITNSLGQIVFTHQIDDKTNTYTKRINCADWSKGIYYVKLFSPTGVKQQKLIIQ